MSIMAESNIYESIAEDAISEKFGLQHCDTDGRFLFMPKIEHNVEDRTMLNMADENEVGRVNMLVDGEDEDTYRDLEQQQIYFEEVMNTCAEVEVDYKPQISSIIHPQPKMEQAWEKNNEYDNVNMEPSFEETVAMPYVEEAENADDSDEETIATFLTAAGQRLALYAVEDSDEVFAVAVYDESGEPPTNFQFLMKSDVERLIGEGAVRTVKKPTQMKKQFESETFVLPQPEVQENFEETFEKTWEEPFEKAVEESFETTIEESSENTIEEPVEKPSEETNEKPMEETFEQPMEESFEPTVEENFETTIEEDFETAVEKPVHETKPQIHNIPSPEYQSPELHITWTNNVNVQTIEAHHESPPKSTFITESKPKFNFFSAPVEQQSSKLDRNILLQMTPQTDQDYVKQSTVQYILFGDEQSDSELTFDDIVKSMQNFKPGPGKSLLKKSLVTSEDSMNDHHSLNGMIDNSFSDEASYFEPVSNASDSSISAPSSPIKSPQTPKNPRRGHLTSALLCRRDNIIDKQRIKAAGTSLLIGNSVAKSAIESSAGSSSVPITTKVKRSRKQQLISVNRDDSEIIIQPASFVSDEEEPIKKRGRGKRKPGRIASYKSKTVVSKRVTRQLRSRRLAVEVIEIDVDEDEDDVTEKNIVEITLDENKEKGSSDKENEVIMVGDSDDEEEEEVNTTKSSTSILLLQCHHCSKSFRQKRALATHSRVCPKSPETVRRINEKSTRRINNRSNDSPAVKKQYMCKMCDEKFDVVVALARHVRMIHSLKKKVNSTNQSRTVTKRKVSSPMQTTSPEMSDISSPGTSGITGKRKRKPGPKRSWKSKKLHCIDCGKWFSSAVLLTDHCLQHATKKSEKQTRRCQICKKIFISRLLYIRHMRMHSRTLQKKSHHTRQATSKLTALRQRGRSRDLRSSD